MDVCGAGVKETPVSQNLYLLETRLLSEIFSSCPAPKKLGDHIHHHQGQLLEKAVFTPDPFSMQ